MTAATTNETHFQLMRISLSAAVVVKGEDAPLECARRRFYGFQYRCQTHISCVLHGSCFFDTMVIMASKNNGTTLDTVTTSSSKIAEGACEKWQLSNRAATRISLGSMKEAIGDRLMASTIDPYWSTIK